MPLSDKGKTLIKHLGYTSSKNTVHWGYWRNFSEKKNWKKKGLRS